MAESNWMGSIVNYNEFGDFLVKAKDPIELNVTYQL